MPLNYNLSNEAEDDVFEAYIWYEEKRKGLGEEFLECLDKARLSILQNPATYQIRFKKKVRAYLVDRFPFLILIPTSDSKTKLKSDVKLLSLEKRKNIWVHLKLRQNYNK